LESRLNEADVQDLLLVASSSERASNRNMNLRDVAAAIVESAGGGNLSTHFE
jgi:hypothetical protein